MPYKIDLRNDEKVNEFLKASPRGTIRAAIEAAAEYLAGNDQRGFRRQPPRVQHGPGNPYKWQSEKQRRAYFATDGFGGGIPYRRTGKSKQWFVKLLQRGYQAELRNTAAAGYMDFIQGQYQQRGHKADGWRLLTDIIQTNLNGMMRAAQQAVNRWLKENGK
jgi:hypothetical protein